MRRPIMRGIPLAAIAAAVVAGTVLVGTVVACGATGSGTPASGGGTGTVGTGEAAVTSGTGTGAGAPARPGSSPGSPDGRFPAAAWPMFGQNAAHTGVATSAATAGRLSLRWRARLDGAVYGQPLVVGGDVIAATENDTVYALNASTGQVAWHKHLGTPVPQSAQHGCGDIFPLGITGTPVYDQANGLVYAVAETAGYRFALFGLDVRTGAVRVNRTLLLAAAGNDPAYDQQRPALTIANGRVYAAWGGLAGDCGPYRGGVLGVPVSGRGRQVTFLTPTSREGAIWGTAGPVAGPTGELWVSIGNGAAEGGPFDGSDSATELTPALGRASFFAPSTWADDNAGDKDLGSTQPVLAAGNSVFIMGKRGTGYLLNASSPGGIGGQRAQQDICPAYGAAAVRGPNLYEPCVGGGTAAISVDQATRRIRLLWRGPAATDGSPVLGGGAVFVTDYKSDPGVLYELDPAGGRVRSQISLGAGLPHFSSLSLAGAVAYVSTVNGVVAVNGA